MFACACQIVVFACLFQGISLGHFLHQLIWAWKSSIVLEYKQGPKYHLVKYMTSTSPAYGFMSTFISTKKGTLIMPWLHSPLFVAILILIFGSFFVI